MSLAFHSLSMIFKCQADFYFSLLRSMQNLSKSSKISKRILTTFKGNLSSAAMGAVERQLKRQETALEKLCR